METAKNFKRINILYWIFTIVFAIMILVSAFPDLITSPEAIKIMHDAMGYPLYIISFINLAKIIGAIVILIPGLDKIKEWAYAGLFIDLTGAVYSGIASAGKADPMMLLMLAWIIPGILSYIYWNKKKAALMS